MFVFGIVYLGLILFVSQHSVSFDDFGSSDGSEDVDISTTDAASSIDILDAINKASLVAGRAAYQKVKKQIFIDSYHLLIQCSGCLSPRHSCHGL